MIAYQVSSFLQCALHGMPVPVITAAKPSLALSAHQSVVLPLQLLLCVILVLHDHAAQAVRWISPGPK